MPKTKKESFIYTVMMCAFMVFCMSIYNVGLHRGFSGELLREVVVGFPIAYVVALVCDWFIVSKPAKKIAFSIVKPQDKPLKKIVMISFCMVCGMVVLMSLYGAVEVVGFSKQLFAVWMKNIPVNFVMALPLQLLIAGPVVRFFFSKLPLSENA